MAETLITLPWVGLTDIEPIRKIVDTKAFQRTKRINQLGFSDLVYSSADSSRGTIMLVTWVITQRITKRLVKKGCIDENTALNINLAGLLHDIGHGPSSHTIEALTKINHVENGARIIYEDEELKDGILSCGGDPGFIGDCLMGHVPEFVIVDDKNFGTDKLTYLVMAHSDTDFGPNISRLVENILYHLKYKDGEMLLDVKAISAGMEIQNAYNYFYKDLFLSKPAQRVQRFMQKMIYKLLNICHRQGGITEEELWKMNDEQLLAAFGRADNEMIQYGYETYYRGVDAFPKSSLTIKLKGRGYLERGNSEKKNLVVEVEESFFDLFYNHCDPESLDKLEELIGDFLGIDSKHVIITNITTRDKKRFVPKDILLFNSFYMKSKISLKSKKPVHFEKLADDLYDYISVRVCISPEFREKAYNKGSDILNLIIDFLERNEFGA